MDGEGNDGETAGLADGGATAGGGAAATGGADEEGREAAAGLGGAEAGVDGTATALQAWPAWDVMHTPATSGRSL